MDSKNIIEITRQAVKESGKPFDKIPQDSILKLLSQNGVNKQSTRLEIYKQLQLFYSNNKKTAVSEVKEDIPVKESRKSIFGEIKRIA